MYSNPKHPDIISLKEFSTQPITLIDHKLRFPSLKEASSIQPLQTSWLKSLPTSILYYDPTA